MKTKLTVKVVDHNGVSFDNVKVTVKKGSYSDTRTSWGGFVVFYLPSSGGTWYITGRSPSGLKFMTTKYLATGQKRGSVLLKMYKKSEPKAASIISAAPYSSIARTFNRRSQIGIIEQGQESPIMEENKMGCKWIVPKTLPAGHETVETMNWEEFIPGTENPFLDIDMASTLLEQYVLDVVAAGEDPVDAAARAADLKVAGAYGDNRTFALVYDKETDTYAVYEYRCSKGISLPIVIGTVVGIGAVVGIAMMGTQKKGKRR